MASIGIPGMIISNASGEQIMANARVSAKIITQPGMAAAWLELGLTQWPEKEEEFNVVYRQLRHRNGDSKERAAWLDEQRFFRFGRKEL